MIGRHRIFTDELNIDRNNVIDVLQNAQLVHDENCSRIDFLLSYESGVQPLAREKTYRPDIDCHVIDNVANEISEFKQGFHWGSPITLVQNGGAGNDLTDAIARLNEQYVDDDNAAKTQEIGRYTEICGIAYEYIDLNEEWERGESYFTIIPLDPRNSFIVYSSAYYDKRKMMGVTYRTDNEGTVHYTCITKDSRFEIVCEKIKNKKGKSEEQWSHTRNSGQKNPFGVINFVEWERSCDRTGCFERQIEDMDMLNLLESDFVNDVDQNTQAVWHGNDVDFPEDEYGNPIQPKTNDWIMTYTQPNGKQPFVKPLSVQYDYKGMLDNIISKRSLILQKCKVPQRNDNSGGSTGIAMSDATGWSEAEMVASKQQLLQERSKKDEVRVVLSVIRKSPNLEERDKKLLDLLASDVKANIKRQKTYEMTTKINAIATGIKNGIDGLSLLNMANLFEDNNEVWSRSKKFVESYQKKLFMEEEEKETIEPKAVPDRDIEKPDKDKTLQDPSDQIDNSPMIDKSRVSNN